jgi:DNA/RNA-binding domain of Phe-tRNA-synthetase-like protein
MEIISSPQVLSKTPNLVVVTTVIQGVRVGETSSALQAEKDAIVVQWQEKQASDLDSVSQIQEYRNLQQQLYPSGSDLLPAVEGMLTRGILKGKFPTINSVVDAGNIVSLTHLVPIGLFDADKITGVITLDLSVAGDVIIPIGKDSPIDIAEGTPILRDEEKIFSLVGVRDSKATMITSTTANILVFSWGLDQSRRQIITQALQAFKEKIQLIG